MENLRIISTVMSRQNKQEIVSKVHSREDHCAGRQTYPLWRTCGKGGVGRTRSGTTTNSLTITLSAEMTKKN